MLLQHYRTLVWMLECFPETVAAELDRPFEGVDKLIEDVDVEVALGNKKIESRMQGMQKSRLLMDRLNEALTVLRKKPDNGERLYNLIYTTYIAPEVLNHQEVLYRLNLSSRNFIAIVSRPFPFFPFVCGQQLRRMWTFGWRW